MVRHKPAKVAMISRALLLLLIVACCVMSQGCGNAKSTAAHSAATQSAPTKSAAPQTAANVGSVAPIAKPVQPSAAPPAAAQSQNAGTSETTKSEPVPPLELPADPNGVVEATFDHLKFDIEPDAEFEEEMLTPTIKKLNDRNVRIRGYIYPTLKKKGIKQFILVRDNLECCFGPGAALYDCILVHMKEGKTAEYSIRPVAVEGKFSFEIFPDYDGTTRAIYRMDGESVE